MQRVVVVRQHRPWRPPVRQRRQVSNPLRFQLQRRRPPPLPPVLLAAVLELATPPPPRPTARLRRVRATRSLQLRRRLPKAKALLQPPLRQPVASPATHHNQQQLGQQQQQLLIRQRALLPSDDPVPPSRANIKLHRLRPTPGSSRAISRDRRSVLLGRLIRWTNLTSRSKAPVTTGRLEIKRPGVVQSLS